MEDGVFQKMAERGCGGGFGDDRDFAFGLEDVGVEWRGFQAREIFRHDNFRGAGEDRREAVLRQPHFFIGRVDGINAAGLRQDFAVFEDDEVFECLQMAAQFSERDANALVARDGVGFVVAVTEDSHGFGFFEQPRQFFFRLPVPQNEAGSERFEIGGKCRNRAQKKRAAIGTNGGIFQESVIEDDAGDDLTGPAGGKEAGVVGEAEIVAEPENVSGHKNLHQEIWSCLSCLLEK